MKKLMAIVLLFLLCSNSFSQTTNGDYNTNYTFTVFEDNFNGSSINRANWEPGLIKRGIGQLIDSSLTHNVSNGKLELSMFNIPNYNNSVDYVGSEFSTKKHSYMVFLNAKQVLLEKLVPGQHFGLFIG